MPEHRPEGLERHCLGHPTHHGILNIGLKRTRVVGTKVDISSPLFAEATQNQHAQVL